MELQIIFQLVLAAVLGGLLGLERESKEREAGLRTFALVCLGACLFTVAAVYLASEESGMPFFSQIDPGRVIQAVAIGIGFLGAGAIIHHQFKIEGLTTAAGLWVVAAIGIAVGIQLYLAAIIVTAIAFAILTALRSAERRLFGP